MRADALRELAQSTGFPKISIYIPTHVKGNEIDQDAIRLKNALQDVRGQLENANVDPKSIKNLLADVSARIDNHIFWRHQNRGLAVFVDEDEARWIKLPKAPAKLAVVADKFHVRALIPFMRDEDWFHVLSVTEDEAKFYEANPREIRELDIADMPDGTAALRGQSDFEANIGFHATSRGGLKSQAGGGQASPQYAALGESPEEHGETILENYLRDVAIAVDGYVAGRQTPIVLVATSRNLGRLREGLKSQGVRDDDIQTDPAALSDDELHHRALEIVKPVLLKDRNDAFDKLAAYVNGDPNVAGSSALQDVIKATEEGRVETLFIKKTENVWGRYDPDHRIVRTDTEATAENEDLLNFAAIKTLEQGGEVYSISDDDVGPDGPVAALMRY